MSKIYTKIGDKGYTTLTGGKKIKKNDPIVNAYGTIDEANSMIGLAVAKLDKESLELVKKMLIEIQNDLFHVGAEISTPEGERIYWPLDTKRVELIEEYIDQLDSQLPELKQFILPGGSESGAMLHVARGIIRRAERIAVNAADEKVITYLNRCSDFLFVAARWVNYSLDKKELNFIPNQNN